MKIKKNHVATLNYRLFDENKQVVDSSEEGGPLVIMVGAQEFIPGIENSLIGKSVGDKYEVNIPSDEAYGDFDEELVEKVPRENFPGIDDIEVGMQFQTEMDDGDPMVVTVVDVDEHWVTVDGNPPMAGKDLNFEIEVTDIRDATPDELAHGHVHHGHSHQH